MVKNQTSWNYSGGKDLFTELVNKTCSYESEEIENGNHLKTELLVILIFKDLTTSCVPPWEFELICYDRGSTSLKSNQVLMLGFGSLNCVSGSITSCPYVTQQSWNE